MNKGQLIYASTTNKGNALLIYDIGEHYRAYEVHAGKTEYYIGSYKKNFFDRYEVIQIVRETVKET